MPSRHFLATIALSLVLATSVHAQTPYLVADLATTDVSSNPQAMARAGDHMLFVAEDTPDTHALFRTDGTEAGTVRLVALTPLATGNFDFLAASTGDLAFFVAGGAGAVQLWRSDGTVPGTFPVIDLATTPTQLLGIEGRLFFRRAGLWTSDGTVEGTFAIPNVPANASTLAPGAGVVYFAATDAAGTELWQSDGTAAGSGPIADVAPGAASAFPLGMRAVGSNVFFIADDGVSGDELWFSDGTDVGTHLVVDANPGPGNGGISMLGSFQGKLLFRRGLGLFLSNGTAAGTAQIATLPGGGTTDAFSYDAGSIAFFVYDGRVWRTDGTSAGTFKVTSDALGGRTIREALLVGNVLFYIASFEVDGLALFRSDGTAAGTVRITGAGAFVPVRVEPEDIAGLGNRVFFGAWLDDEKELFVSDGTAPGTGLVADVGQPGTQDASLRLPIAVGAELAIVERPPSAGDTLWLTDGTAAGTAPLVVDHTTIAFLATLGSHLFWGSVDGLVRDDGTTVYPRFPSALTRAGDRLYFNDGDGVWVTDGTAPGTVTIATITGPTGCGMLGCISLPSSARSFTWAATRTFFVASGEAGFELWRSDGTPGGTSLVSTFNYETDVIPLAPLGSSVVFGAGAPSQLEPHVSDGTSIVRIKDIVPGTAGSNPREYTSLGDTVYFAATEPTGGRELWRTDGTEAGTWRVADIAPGTASSNPAELTALDGVLYFVATDPSGGREPWRTDGTEEGTTRLADLAPGSAGSDPGALTAGNGRLLFAATTPDAGREPWISDGTTTALLGDLKPGAFSSDPVDFTFAGPRVFFVAEHPVAGREPWAADLPCIADVDLDDVCDDVDWCLGPDVDHDNICDDLDSCLAPDADDDGVCDDVDACRLAEAPLDDARVTLRKLGPPAGDERFTVSGAITAAAPDDVDPSAGGLRLLLTDDTGGVVLDAAVAGGPPWKAARRGRSWTYKSKTSPMQSIRVRQRRPDEPFDVKIAGKGGGAAMPAVAASLLATIDLAPAMTPAVCGETVFAPEACKRGGGDTQISCR